MPIIQNSFQEGTTIQNQISKILVAGLRSIRTSEVSCSSTLRLMLPCNSFAHTLTICYSMQTGLKELTLQMSTPNASTTAQAPPYFSFALECALLCLDPLAAHLLSSP